MIKLGYEMGYVARVIDSNAFSAQGVVTHLRFRP
jgi:hypothetical protein